jgi:hypothetical protein
VVETVFTCTAATDLTGPVQPCNDVIYLFEVAPGEFGPILRLAQQIEITDLPAGQSENITFEARPTLDQSAWLIQTLTGSISASFNVLRYPELSEAQKEEFMKQYCLLSGQVYFPETCEWFFEVTDEAVVEEDLALNETASTVLTGIYGYGMDATGILVNYPPEIVFGPDFVEDCTLQPLIEGCQGLYGVSGLPGFNDPKKPTPVTVTGTPSATPGPRTFGFTPEVTPYLTQPNVLDLLGEDETEAGALLRFIARDGDGQLAFIVANQETFEALKGNLAFKAKTFNQLLSEEVSEELRGSPNFQTNGWTALPEAVEIGWPQPWRWGGFEPTPLGPTMEDPM